jgi:hypothetical protein
MEDDRGWRRLCSRRVFGDDGEMYLETFRVKMLRKLADDTFGAAPAKVGDC